MNVTVKAVVNVTEVIARGMVEQKRGAIVNMSSLVSQRHWETGYIYCVAQGALDQLTRCQAVELGPFNIRVNSVHPTVVDTPGAREWRAHSPEAVDCFIRRAPIKREAGIQDVVNAVIYLLSDKADMINGAFLPVDGGWMCT